MTKVSATTITVNGKSYDSIDDVPEVLKKFVEDKNADGMPDTFEGAAVLRKKGFTANIVSPDQFVQNVLPEVTPDTFLSSTRHANLNMLYVCVGLVIGFLVGLLF